MWLLLLALLILTFKQRDSKPSGPAKLVPQALFLTAIVNSRNTAPVTYRIPPRPIPFDPLRLDSFSVVPSDTIQWRLPVRNEGGTATTAIIFFDLGARQGLVQYGPGVTLAPGQSTVFILEWPVIAYPLGRHGGAGVFLHEAGRPFSEHTALYNWDLLINPRPAPCGLLGDINGNGLIDVEDFVDVQNLQQRPVIPGDKLTERANVAGGGLIDISDLTAHQAYLVGLKHTFPGCS